VTTKKIKIPEDIGSAESRLAALDGIATATGWERAAIVYAFTYDAGRGRPTVNAGNSAFTVKGFADLKIVGLTDRGTVNVYRDHWKEAIATGDAVDIQPGDTVTLPAIPFPPTETGGTKGYNTPEGAQKTIDKIVQKHGAQVLAPQVAKPAVAAAVANNAQASSAVIRERVQRTRKITEDRKAAAAAAPTAAAQAASVTDATDTAADQFPSNSPIFNAIERFEAEAHNRWLEGIRKQMFTDMDRAHMAAFHARLVRFALDVEAFATAEDDPYAAVEAARAQYEEEFNREMDAAEAGMADTSDLDAAVDEIERFANEGA
jgi:hypothetical protein